MFAKGRVMPEYKNSFDEPKFYEHVIKNDEGKIGTLRVKPSTVLWKPKGGQAFYSVSIDQFERFIVESGRRVDK
jgi:hypothetical protein